MSNNDIDDLQARIAFQEDLLQVLNQRVSDQEKHIDTLTIQLQHLSKKLKTLESSIGPGLDVLGGARDEPPPHY